MNTKLFFSLLLCALAAACGGGGGDLDCGPGSDYAADPYGKTEYHAECRKQEQEPTTCTVQQCASPK